MTDADLLELTAAHGISWGIGADTGRPRVVYIAGRSLQVIDIEIAPEQHEVRIDPLLATRRAIAQAISEARAKAH